MKSHNPVQNVAKMSMKNLTQVVANKSAERDATRAEHTDVERRQEIARNAKLAELKNLLSDVTSHEITGRYKIGLVVVDVKNDPKKYGKEAVKQLAEELGYEKSSLYEYSNVAEAWTSKDFENVCVQRTGSGLPISFSHLVELLAVKEQKKRDKLLAKVFKDSLSVRALRDLIRGHEGNVSTPNIGSQPSNSSLPRTLADLVSAVDASLHTQKQWHLELPSMCQGPSTKILADQIATAKAKLEAQRTGVEEAIKMLEIEHHRIEAELGAAISALSVQTSQPSAGTNGHSNVTP